MKLFVKSSPLPLFAETICSASSQLKLSRKFLVLENPRRSRCSSTSTLKSIRLDAMTTQTRSIFNFVPINTGSSFFTPIRRTSSSSSSWFAFCLATPKSTSTSSLPVGLSSSVSVFSNNARTRIRSQNTIRRPRSRSSYSYSTRFISSLIRKEQKQNPKNLVLSLPAPTPILPTHRSTLLLQQRGMSNSKATDGSVRFLHY